MRERSSQHDDESALLSHSSNLETSHRLSKQSGVPKPRIKDSPTQQDINRLGARDGALTVELDDMVEGSTTETADAAELGPARQVPGRHVASLVDPERAQKEATERQAAEESLFDDLSLPVTEDQTIEEAQKTEPIKKAAVLLKYKRSLLLRLKQDIQIQVREIKAARELKRVKPSHVRESSTPSASQVELASPRRLVNLEEQIPEGL